MEYGELEAKAGYAFTNRELLLTALTHSSYSNEYSKKRGEIGFNERLEFLGDAVLELVTSQFLFESNPDMPEGSMSKLRAAMVCEPSLAFCARELGLGDFLRLGKGEDMTGGRNRDSILSDAFEALIGAIYLDGGLEKAQQFIHTRALSKLNEARLFKDSKTMLQEITQEWFHCMPEYVLLKEEGPAHMRRFTVEVHIAGKPFAVGVGTSKKGAEQEAARKAVIQLQEGSGDHVPEKH